MKTKLFTTLAATAGLLIAGFALSSQAAPNLSTTQGVDAASKAVVSAPASCHVPAKAEADHCAAKAAPTCDHTAKTASSGETQDKACGAGHEAAPVAMNCPMHAMMKMKGCCMGGSH